MGCEIWQIVYQEYQEYLNRKKADSGKYKSSLVPAKALDENSSIRHLEPCVNLDETYEI